ncbi:serine--tRNA ligase [Thermomicrobiaceae bacterium CFH 74404]|uniref:Serine--tRNA ligase n=2 Tax=Thermomicrobia TaxID=189775 RepID=A0AA42BB61_9BACT|nr:serine--tRNA ligase [Thermalbibacter longus]MCM8749400.1 serine--tRNA ligase [Thermalbibacter longus]
MLDLRLIREQTDLVREALVKLNTEAPIDAILELDERRRQLIAEVERLKAERNAESKRIGRLPAGPEREQAIAAMRALGDRIEQLDAELAQVEARLEELLLEVPNLPDPDVPVGPDDSANVVVRHWGEPRTFDFPVRPHWEIAEELRLIDFARGVKVSGSRFYVLRGDLARLQRALITWMIDLHVREHGYFEVYPPDLVRREAMVGTGNLPKFGDNLYHDEETDLWLIPTAEVPVTNLYRDEILPPGVLPIYLVAHTPCFRKERVSAGRDVRGIKRVHQFEKVEMVKFVEPETSDDELTSLLGNAEDVLQRLELPYRVVQICTGDLSFTAAKKFDLEVWAPGSQEWLEVSSCSNFRDFQARRANIRYRPAEGARPQYVHTLNGSGLALPRTLIAIMENYQQPDGSFVVPEVLRPYMGGQEVIGPQPAYGLVPRAVS